jgi:hypothetical protein
MLLKTANVFKDSVPLSTARPAEANTNAARTCNWNICRPMLCSLSALECAFCTSFILHLFTSSFVSSTQTPSTPSWRGGHTPSYVSSRPQARHPIPLPTLDQRRRVLDLLTSLSPHHTKDCTRNSQPLYVHQSRDRYAPLIGHNSPSSSSWLSGFGLGLDEELDKKRRDLMGNDHKYFFGINLYNSFDIIPDLFATLFRVASILGYHNVYVSIYENGSTDQTKALLRIFDALTRSVGMRITIRTSQRTRGAFNHRIEYLAEVRNAAFVPLHELRESEGEYFDSVIFMNDILPCVDDLLELIWQSRRNNAGITCAADYMYHEDIVRILLSISSHQFADYFYRVLRYFTITGLRATSTALLSKMPHSKPYSTTLLQLITSNGIFLYKSSHAGME